MYVLYYVCVGIGSLDWLEKGYIYMKAFELIEVWLLMTEFDCPEVALCSWLDLKSNH